MKRFLARYLMLVGAWAILLLAAVLVNALRLQSTGSELLARPLEFAFLVPFHPWDLIRGWLLYATVLLGPPALVTALWHWRSRRTGGQAA